MALPADLDLVPVRGQYVRLDGAAVSGKVTFTSTTVLTSPRHSTTVVPTVITATLDSNGSFEVFLPATDDPDIAPSGWTYGVKEDFPAGGRSFAIQVPLSAKTDGLDLSTVAPVSAAVGNAAASFVLLGAFNDLKSRVTAIETDGGGSSTPVDLSDYATTEELAGKLSQTMADGRYALLSKPTTVKTVSYAATPGEIVVVDPTGRTLVDATAGSGVQVLTSASGEFLPTDVGRRVRGYGLVEGTVIDAFTSANSVHLSKATVGNVAASGTARKVALEGDVVITLPVSADPGAAVEVKSVGWGSGLVTVVPSGSDTIDGAASLSITGFGVSKRFVRDSAGWRPTSGLTPTSGPASPKYTASLDLYLPSSSCLSRARSAWAAARTGVDGPFRELHDGDSTRYGVLGGGGNFSSAGYNPSNLTPSKFNPTARLRTKLAQRLGARADLVFAGPAFTEAGAGNYWTLTNLANLNASWTVTNQAALLTPPADQPVTGFEIEVLRTSSVAIAGATYQIDGAAAVALDLSAATGNGNAAGYTSVQVGALAAGAHTLQINGPSAGSFTVKRVSTLNSSAPAFAQVRNAGVSGQTLATKVSAASTTANGGSYDAITRWAPHLVMIPIGINDMHGWAAASGTPAAGAEQYRQNLVTYARFVRASGGDPIFEVFPSYNYALQGAGAFEAYLWHQAVYSVADSEDVAVLDLQRRWGYGYGPVEWAQRKWPMYDGTHPTLVGYDDIASAETNVLTAALSA